MSMLYRFAKCVACAAVLTVAATWAKAEQFRVTLPVATEWGATTLPAGDYQVTTEEMGIPYLKLQGNGHSVFVLLSSAGYQDNAKDAIKVVNANGKAYVQELSFSYSGMVYRLTSAKKQTPHAVAFRLKKQLEEAAH